MGFYLNKLIDNCKYTGKNMSDAEKGAPPSYNSVFGKLKAEREKGTTSFLKNSSSILAQSGEFSVFILLLLVIPVLMIVYGSINIKNCQVESYIPIWLIVAGVFSIIQQLLQLLNYWNKRNTPEEEQEANKTSQAGSTLLGCFNIAWFICGNVWVFGAYNDGIQFDDPTSDKYCEQTTFYLAFWSIIVAYIIIGLFCFCGCCICACIGWWCKSD